jgi:uncharacterized phage protein (TIGR02218 family)
VARAARNYSGSSSSSSLPNHLAGSALSVCWCLKVTPTTGSIVGFTSRDSDLSTLTGHVGVTFKSSTGATASQIEYAGGVHSANLEVDTLIASAGLTEAALLAGVWTGATWELFIVNYNDLTMGDLPMGAGKVGRVKIVGQSATIELNGWNNSALIQIGRPVTPECDADLGDSRCGLNLSARSEVFTNVAITTATSQSVFRCSSMIGKGSDYFVNGKVLWTTGANSGLPAAMIKSWNDATGEITLQLAMPYSTSTSDRLTLTRGCQKRLDEDCVTKFSNAVNFRGFPHLPGIENALRIIEG